MSLAGNLKQRLFSSLLPVVLKNTLCSLFIHTTREFFVVGRLLDILRGNSGLIRTIQFLQRIVNASYFTTSSHATSWGSDGAVANRRQSQVLIHQATKKHNTTLLYGSAQLKTVAKMSREL